MNYLTSITFLAFLLCCCTRYQEIDYKRKPSELEGWNIEIKEGIVDTLKKENWLPEPELTWHFVNAADSTCLAPTLEFYPIEMEEYIGKKLKHYLLYRAMSFPPIPNTYTTKKYFVIGWNLIDSENLKCCGCDELEEKLVKELALKTKFKSTEH